jgi:hypothetical protein
MFWNLECLESGIETGQDQRALPKNQAVPALQTIVSAMS